MPPALPTPNLLLALLSCSGITGGKFLERGKVYKHGNKLVRAARVCLPTLLGALDLGCTVQPRTLTSSPPAPFPHPLQAWYTEEDLHVGAVLDLHGRRFRLTMADAFTEQYHDSKRGAAQ